MWSEKFCAKSQEFFSVFSCVVFLQGRLGLGVLQGV